MLTVKIWRVFWVRYLLESFIFLIPFFIVSLIFSSGFVYMGEDTSSILLMIFKTQPNLVFISLAKIIFTAWIICLGLGATCLSASLELITRETVKPEALALV